MDNKRDLPTFSYKINNINYYVIYLNDHFYMVKSDEEGQTLQIEEEDKNVFREILEKVRQKKYKFIRTINYKGQKFKEYLNQIDGLLYFTTQQNGKEVACTYDEYTDLYNQANFIKKIGNTGESFGDNDSSNDLENGPNDSPNNDKNDGPSETTISNRWEELKNVAPNSQQETAEEYVTGEKDIPTESIESLDKTAEILNSKNSTGNTAKKLFVPIAAVAASIAIFITGCDDPSRKSTNFDPSAIYHVYDMKSTPLASSAVRRILSENGFDEQSIEEVLEDYETRLGIGTSTDTTETIPDNETVKQAVDAIENNANLSESDKSYLIEMFTPWMSANSAYLDKYCIERLTNLKIQYNTEEGAAQTYGAAGYTGNLMKDGEIYRGNTTGTVERDENGHTIVTFESDKEPLEGINYGIVINAENPDSMMAKSTLTHEFIHVLMPNWPEGMVELYNPNKNGGEVYLSGQLMMAILEEIYGSDTIKNALPQDNTLSILAENEEEAKLLITAIWGDIYTDEDSAREHNGTTYSAIFDSLKKLYETKHPNEDTSENLVFNLCQDMIYDTNTAGIAKEEGDKPEIFLYKGDELYVVYRKGSNSTLSNNASPILETFGLDQQQAITLDYLVRIK